MKREFIGVTMLILGSFIIIEEAKNKRRVHVHGPKESRAHPLCGIPDEIRAQ